MAVDLDQLWDFQSPVGSEQRFQQALGTASGSDAIILQTQIARTYGMRKDFARAREILFGIQTSAAQTGGEAAVRFFLELGRTYASGAHDPTVLSSADKTAARNAYLEAFALAETSRLDGLAIDALHMLAFVDTEPVQQLHWADRA